jgi:hypothetical protein
MQSLRERYGNGLAKSQERVSWFLFEPENPGVSDKSVRAMPETHLTDIIRHSSLHHQR